MLSKRLYFNFFIRVVLLLVCSLAFSYGLLEAIYELSIVMAVALALICYKLVKLFNGVNRKIAHFFNAINNEDFSLRFSNQHQVSSVKELHQSLENVKQLLSKLHLKKEHQERYYQEVLNQADIGILIINLQGHILFSNPAIEKLLNHTPLTHIAQLKEINSQLFESFKHPKANNRQLIVVNNERESKQLMVKSTLLTHGEEVLHLFTLQDIKHELEEKETDSWTKLARVLIHEIMNSIAPITSISDSILTLQMKEEKAPTTDATITKGLQVIKSQSKDLISFVESYRSFLNIPQPDRSIVKVEELCAKVKLLIQNEIENSTIEFHCETETALEIFADEQQITQVLINLIKNAIDSITENGGGTIRLSYGINKDGKKWIELTDDGKGIPEDLLEQIFIPFFTGKESGTGIGLSLSKRIMQLHGGRIAVTSSPFKSTSFVLEFNDSL